MRDQSVQYLICPLLGAGKFHAEENSAIGSGPIMAAIPMATESQNPSTGRRSLSITIPHQFILKKNVYD
jgi:hypothetical protein